MVNVFQAATSWIAIPQPAASSRFGNFKPPTEGIQQVRTPTISGDNLQRLRDLRTMLRSMTPEQAYNAIEWHQNLTFFEAVALAKREGKLIVPNDVIDRILPEIAVTFGVRTGTLFVYEKPGQPFGKTVVFSNINFLVPEQFQGIRKGALVVDYPDFELVSLRKGQYQISVPDIANIRAMKRFPHWAGKCGVDYDSRTPEDRSPDGNYYESNRLHRSDAAYIGLLARSCFGDDEGYGFFLDNSPSNRLGVALV